MSPRKRLLLLLVIMSVIVLIVETITFAVLYRTAIGEETSRLEEAAKSQARLIEAIVRFNRVYTTNYPDGAIQAMLTQVRDAHSKYRGFGETGEFTLSAREHDQIVFLLNHRHYDLNEPKPVPWGSKWAEPMRQALSGRSGTIVGLDYRGERVLAAHEPLPELGLGIVAKIDLSEIRQPFIRAGLLIGSLAIAVIAIGAVIFLRLTNPILERLRHTVTQLEKALREVKTLRGMVPICSFCKKIRDDKGYWDQVEKYVQEHSEATFTHGICPECLRKHYPELKDIVQKSGLSHLRSTPNDGTGMP